MKKDYNIKYNIKTYILLFFFFAFFGYIYEVLIYLVQTGSFINKGTLYGPWLPIYGWGGVLMILFTKKHSNKPWLVFILTMLVAGVLEYLTSMYLEYFRHLKYWDYSGFYLSINGRVCGELLFVFGVFGLAGVYLFAPFVNKLEKRIPKKVISIICIVLISLFIVDNIYAYFYPRFGEGLASIVNN